MQYMLYQLRSHNNDYFNSMYEEPILSFYNKFDDAFNKVYLYIDVETKQEQIFQLDTIKKHLPICINQWNNQRNQNKYQIIELIPNIMYDLNKFDISPSLGNTLESSLTKYSYKINFMLLCTRITRSNYQSDTFSYYVSFHETHDAIKYQLKKGFNISSPPNSSVSTSDDHYEIFELTSKTKINLFQNIFN